MTRILHLFSALLLAAGLAAQHDAVDFDGVSGDIQGVAAGDLVDGAPELARTQPAP